jgi:hypothetical protein
MTVTAVATILRQSLYDRRGGLLAARSLAPTLRAAGTKMRQQSGHEILPGGFVLEDEAISERRNGFRTSFSGEYLRLYGPST